MKKILLTCDTEIGDRGIGLENAFSILVNGDFGSRSVGINLMEDIADSYSAKITHFVDVYQPLYQNEICRLCEKIKRRGHEIGLHTHPVSKYGKNYMYEYSFDEQCEIISFGRRLIEDVIGEKPIVHRAGSYGANNDTLRALHSNGIYIDSSLYYGNSRCRIESDCVNEICKINNVWEVPVTVYKTKGLIRQHYVKLDYKFGSNVDTIIEVLNKMNEDSTIVLFFHSFNFLNRYWDYRKKYFYKINIDDSAIDKFERLLKYISDRNDMQFTKFSDIKLGRCKNDIVDMGRNIDIRTWLNVLKVKVSGKGD